MANGRSGGRDQDHEWKQTAVDLKTKRRKSKWQKELMILPE